MKYDIIVVGGGPAGIISAVTAKKNYPKKNILAIRDVEAGVVPCGIPYMFHTLKKCEENALGSAPFLKNKIKVMIDEVNSINKKSKSIKTKNNGTIRYSKLILAVGSSPVIPPIPGHELKGVYAIQKEMKYLKKLKSEIKKASNIVVIGGGFIGVEFADELSKFKNKKVSIVEFQKSILANSFDKEFIEQTTQELVKNKVNIITDVKAEKIVGKDKVTSVLLSNNKKIKADLVIIGIGARPNSKLAEDCGLEIGKTRAISVDEYMRTSDPNILAVGDCAEKRDFFTRRCTNVMLASTATAEARIAGSNLFQLRLLRSNKGTIAVYSTKVGELSLGSAGLTEKFALKEGFDIVVGSAFSPDKHPGKLPGTKQMNIKLIFQRESGILLGGQVSGGVQAGEVVNILAVAIQKSMTMSEIETLQFATHPKLTAAPTTYPIVVAAQSAIKKL